MNAIEHIPAIEPAAVARWQRYLLDTLLAIAGALAVTGLLYAFQLYPRIPNASVAYLLVVLALASTRGRYSAILASVVAFLSFDFFLVPPLFLFTINRPEEWIALFVFLAVAIITGQLASALRQRAEEAARRERETRILYELVRATNSEEDIQRQLNTIAEALVTVFASWGVRECTLLLPNERDQLVAQAHAPQTLHPLTLSSDEYTTAMQVVKEGKVIGLHEARLVPHRSPGSSQRVVVQSSVSAPIARLYLLPLKTGQRVLGVMRLRLVGGPLLFPGNADPQEQRTAFFWTFLDQATNVIERVSLRQEHFLVEVLQRTDALRIALLSSVSHDLRTPLSSIKAAASSLLQHDVQWDEESKRSFALTIEREADRLNRLVGNLLDMSRIEEGAIKPEKEWLAVNELVNSVLERMQALLHGREIRVKLPEEPLQVKLDFMQMDQVLTNLIENAVRYTPATSPIDITVERDGANLVIKVADRGPGIPAADLERVFDKFYRVQPASDGKSHPSGTGLGLAVSKGLVEAHGGRIRAVQRPGGGVVFTVELPIDGPTKELSIQQSAVAK